MDIEDNQKAVDTIHNQIKDNAALRSTPLFNPEKYNCERCKDEGYWINEGEEFKRYCNCKVGRFKCMND